MFVRYAQWTAWVHVTRNISQSRTDDCLNVSAYDTILAALKYSNTVQVQTRQTPDKKERKKKRVDTKNKIIKTKARR